MHWKECIRENSTSGIIPLDPDNPGRDAPSAATLCCEPHLRNMAPAESRSLSIPVLNLAAIVERADEQILPAVRSCHHVFQR